LDGVDRIRLWLRERVNLGAGDGLSDAVLPIVELVRSNPDIEGASRGCFNRLRAAACAEPASAGGELAVAGAPDAGDAAADAEGEKGAIVIPSILPLADIAGSALAKVLPLPLLAGRVEFALPPSLASLRSSGEGEAEGRCAALLDLGRTMADDEWCEDPSSSAEATEAVADRV
jgi:hypothetical protein